MIPSVEWTRKNSWRVVSSCAPRIQALSPAASSPPDHEQQNRGGVQQGARPPQPGPARPRPPPPAGPRGQRLRVELVLLVGVKVLVVVVLVVVPVLGAGVPGRRRVHPAVAVLVVVDPDGAGGGPLAGVAGRPAAGVLAVARPLRGVVAVQVGAAELLEQRLAATRRAGTVAVPELGGVPEPGRLAGQVVGGPRPGLVPVVGRRVGNRAQAPAVPAVAQAVDVVVELGHEGPPSRVECAGTQAAGVPSGRQRENQAAIAATSFIS
jgi:hypothetical protein